jgi:hypothetical protein
LLQIGIMKNITLLFSVLLLWSCSNTKKEKLSAQEIVDKTIETSCNGNCENAIIEFSFRNRTYRSERQQGKFSFERITTDSTSKTLDVLNNSGFTRYIDGEPIILHDSIAVKYSNSVNSVHYFVQIPYVLNAPAAKKELLPDGMINEQPYYKIKVRFSEEGGGTDHDDTFVYWIHKEAFTVDYLAYKYSVDGGGIRFREAYNPRIIKGIRFVDYRNYKPESKDIALTELDSLYESGKLKLLSNIENEAVRVTLPQDN